MIFGIGVDITEIERVGNIQKRLGFAQKVLTSNEFEVWKNMKEPRSIEFLAGRFSAKESYSKAFGTGLGRQLGFKDIEILDNDVGKPIITKHPFKGTAHVSLSHTKQVVMTEVILEEID